MIEEVNPKLLAMPTDEELYDTFFWAATQGAHDNIKPIVSEIGKFLGDAKGEVKHLVNFDPEKGLSIKMDMNTGNLVLKGFVDCQPLLKRAPLKALMALYSALTFDDFIAKMKKTEDNTEVTKGTLSRVLIMFASGLSRKYVVNETEEHIKGMVYALFD